NGARTCFHHNAASRTCDVRSPVGLSSFALRQDDKHTHVPPRAKRRGIMLDRRPRAGYFPRSSCRDSFRTKGKPMFRWGIALAAVVALGYASQLHAQVPTGGNGLKFVPVDTTRNLAAPVPMVYIPQPKMPLPDRLHNFFASFIPFMTKR